MNEQIVIILILESVLYLLIASISLGRAGFKGRISRELISYAVLSSLWVGSLAARASGLLNQLNFPPDIITHLSFYSILILALVLLYLTKDFLRLKPLRWQWWLIIVIWLGLTLGLDSGLSTLPDTLWSNGQFTLERITLTYGLLLGGWAIFAISAVYLSVSVYRQTKQPLLKNRLKYWAIALTVTLAGDIVSFAGYDILGIDIRLLGTLLMAYAVLTHSFPDMRQTSRRVVSYLLITLSTVVIYIVGLIALPPFLETLPGFDRLTAVVTVAIILAVLVQPLFSLIQKQVNKLVFGTGYDARSMLGEYSSSISNILDLERLATVAVGLINEALEIQRGAIFTVDYKEDENANEIYVLTAIKGMGSQAIPSGTLSEESAVARYLWGEHHALTQYDIDFLDPFKDIPETERTWLTSLDMDVYVPIYTQGMWIGMLALGPKISGDRYYDDDFVLLSTIADQTAVALENARLVDNLRKINEDLSKTTQALDQANRQMQELDKLKSAFIGVITHELRTPYANIVFSLEILQRHGDKYLPKEMLEVVDQMGNGIHLAKRMVDNLVTFATFLSKQGDLNLAELNFSKVVQDSILPLESLAETKNVSLKKDLPAQLPTFQGDQERLTDAIYHLVHNSIKFTEGGGKIWVSCGSSNGSIHFAVKDTGVGVPADKLPDLWEGFSQMADPLLRGQEGLGLGLTLVKYIVTAHGGKVWAKSEVGKGSTFGFEIPINT